MTAVVLRAELTDQPIELSEYEALVAHESAGAVVGFAGVVRDHDDGRTVIRLEYSAHPSAQQTLADVAAEIAAVFRNENPVEIEPGKTLIQHVARHEQRPHTSQGCQHGAVCPSGNVHRQVRVVEQEGAM